MYIFTIVPYLFSITSLILLSLAGELFASPCFSKELIYHLSQRIALQNPVQPHNERVPQGAYLGPILYLMDGKLHRNVEAVQNIASKYQSVHWSVDGMNPAFITKKSTTHTQKRFGTHEKDSCKFP